MPSLWPLYLVLMILCIIGFPWAIPPLTTASDVGAIICEGIIFGMGGKCGLHVRWEDIAIMVIKVLEIGFDCTFYSTSEEYWVCLGDQC